MKQGESPLPRQEGPANPEEYKELVGKITIFRHGQTAYTGRYPDLSEKGKDALFAAGEKLQEQIDEETEDLIFFHSPAPRAKGSMGYLLHGMGRIPDTNEQTVEGVARAVAPLRAVKKLDPEAAQEMINRHIGSDAPTAEQYESFDRMYVLSEEFDHSPHWEPKSAAPKRSNRLLRFAIKALVENHAEKENSKIPHVVATAHFETINDIAKKVFNLDMEKDPLFARGESFTFEVKTKPEEGKRVLLICGFRGEKRNAWFDFERGEVVPTGTN